MKVEFKYHAGYYGYWMMYLNDSNLVWVTGDQKKLCDNMAVDEIITLECQDVIYQVIKNTEEDFDVIILN